jgi:hypothetical protein
MTTSELLALEAPDRSGRGGRGDARHLPCSPPRGIGLRLYVGGLVISVDAQILPLRQRGGLLRTRRRDNEPSRSASDGAACDENQGNSERTSVHAHGVA